MKRQSISNGLRQRVLARDDYTCQYCGAQAPHVALELDHIVPVSRGGLSTAANLVTACSECNGGKGVRRRLPAIAHRHREGIVLEAEELLAVVACDPEFWPAPVVDDVPACDPDVAAWLAAHCGLAPRAELAS